MPGSIKWNVMGARAHTSDESRDRIAQLALPFVLYRCYRYTPTGFDPPLSLGSGAMSCVGRPSGDALCGEHSVCAASTRRNM